MQLDEIQKHFRARPALGRTQLDQLPLNRGFGLVQYHPRAHAIAADDHRTIFCIGRPRIRQSIISTDALVHDWILSNTPDGLEAHAESISEALTGMYAVFEVTQTAVTVLTDRMGFRPVYVSRDHEDRITGIGTHLESLARCTGQATDFDRVSLAELLVHNFITFPYTTRDRIRELDPCSVSKINPSTGEIVTRVLWEPTEPKSFASSTVLSQRLKEAIKNAANDLTLGCSSGAVLLSGGFDSRLVIAAVPKDRVRTALTYVTNENRETGVAGSVADAAGVEHVLVRRDRDYFPGLVGRGMELLGMELRGNTHGLCLADNELADRFDVIIGGQLSDTLLKDHFMPFAQRDKLLSNPLKQFVKRLVKGSPAPRVVSAEHTTGRGQLEKHLCADIRDRLRARKEERMDEVRRVRPNSADEWHRFWPGSRQDDSSHTLGNARLTISDTLFAHTDIIEVARDLSPAMRAGGRLADAVYMEICGKLGEITNANTGLPANASSRRVRAQNKKKWAEHRARAETSGERTDWNAVENSWADPVAMQKHAPFWISSRERLLDSPAIGLLDGLLERGGRAMIAEYQDDLPSTTNHIAMQMMLWGHGLLASERFTEAGGCP